MIPPQYLHHQCPCHLSEPQSPHASSGDPPSPAGKSVPGSSEVTPFSPGSWCTQEFMCTLQECSFCFPKSCGVPAIKPHWPPKPNAVGAPLPDVRPQTREPDVGLRTLTLVGEPLQYNYFPVCGSPTWWLWDLIVLWTCLSYHLAVASSSEVEYPFCRFQSFLSMVVQQFVVILVFSWE